MSIELKPKDYKSDIKPVWCPGCGHFSIGGNHYIHAQGFIATHQTELFSVAIILLLLALYQNAKKVMSGSCCKI